MWLARVTHFLERIVNLIVNWTNTAAGGVLLLMVFFVTADVILRYVFNRPIIGSVELTEFMMAIVAGFALTYTALHKGHISVELIVSRFSPRALATTNSITCLLTLGIFAVMTWRMVVYAEMLRTGNFLSGSLEVPVYFFVYIVALASALICLILLVNLFDHLSRVVKEARPWVQAGLLLVIALFVVLFASPVWGQGLLWEVSPITAGFMGTALLIVMLFSGISVGIAMILVGFLGIVYINNIGAGLGTMGTSPYCTIDSYINSVLPLFILMGCITFYSGISKELFTAVNNWIGRLPGGMAMATMGACAFFSCISGSSNATSATMGTVVLPEMKRCKYDSALATGSIAAGAGLDILIPPSTILVIYGIITEVPIGKLLLAGFIPGAIQTLLLMITIYILCKRNPLIGPKAAKVSFGEKVMSLKGLWPVLVLFVVVFGGLYIGIFTTTEAAGIGAFGALVFALTRKGFSWRKLKSGLDDTAMTTGMCFLILIGGILFGYFLAVSRLPFTIADFLTALEVNRYFVLSGILIIYLFLGCIMSAMAMIIITVPIFLPVMVALGFDPIWFGIICTLMVEIGQLTPPVGINVYIVKGVAKDIPMYTIFRGIVPFLFADICATLIVIVFPQTALILPNMMN